MKLRIWDFCKLNPYARIFESCLFDLVVIFLEIYSTSRLPILSVFKDEKVGFQKSGGFERGHYAA